MKKMPNFKPIVAATAATAGVVTSAGVVGGLVYAHQAHREKISSGLKEIQREGIQNIDGANLAAEHLWGLPDEDERKNIREMVEKYVSENDDVIYKLSRAAKLKLLSKSSSEFVMLKLLKDKQTKAEALKRIANHDENSWKEGFDLKLLESELPESLLFEYHSAASAQLMRALRSIEKKGPDAKGQERRKALDKLEKTLLNKRREDKTKELTDEITAIQTSFMLKDMIRKKNMRHFSDADYAVRYFENLNLPHERQQIMELVLQWVENDENDDAEIKELSKTARTKLLYLPLVSDSEVAMLKLLRDEDEEVKAAALERIVNHNEADWGEGFDLKLLKYLPELLNSKLKEQAIPLLMRALENINKAGPELPERFQALEKLQSELETYNSPGVESLSIQTLIQKARNIAVRGKMYYDLKNISNKEEINMDEANFALKHLWYLFQNDDKHRSVKERIKLQVGKYVEGNDNIYQLSKDAKEKLLWDVNSEFAMWKLLSDEDEEVKAQALRRIKARPENLWNEEFISKLLESNLPNLLLVKVLHPEASAQLRRTLRKIRVDAIKTPQIMEALRKLERVLKTQSKSSADALIHQEVHQLLKPS